jgi:hypothetical protein
MMRTTWIGGAIVALTCAGVAAQTTQPPTPTERSSSSAQAVTFSGCLQRADASSGATGTTGTAAGGATAGAASGSDRFVLQNAQKASGSSSAGGATAGGTTAGGTTAGTTGASSSAGGSGTTYQLEGNASELRNHVGHQVEVTGRLDSSMSGSGSTAGATAGGTTAGGATAGASSSSGPKLRVESVKMVSSSCASR